MEIVILGHVEWSTMLDTLEQGRMLDIYHQVSMVDVVKSEKHAPASVPDALTVESASMLLERWEDYRMEDSME